MMGNRELPHIESRVPDEQKLRRYLLGQGLAGESEEVEKALLANAEVSDWLSVLEDELTEDYVTGELNDTDRASFERLFLTNEERRMKTRLSAMLLKREDVLESLNSGTGFNRETGKLSTTSSLLDVVVMGRETNTASPPGEVVSHKGRWFAAGAVVVLLVSALAVRMSMHSSGVMGKKAPTRTEPAPEKRHTMEYYEQMVHSPYKWNFPPPGVSKKCNAGPPPSPSPGRNPVPCIESASLAEPKHGIAGARQIVILLVTGSGFVEGTVIRLNGREIHPDIVASDRLTAAIAAPACRSCEIVVVSPAPGGGSSPPATLTFTGEEDGLTLPQQR
jgi:hypothetical protein